MRVSLLPMLRCPLCAADRMTMVVTKRDAYEVRSGSVVCTHCGHWFAIRDGIVDLLPHPSETVVREQEGWHALLGETSAALDQQMLELPYLSDPHWQAHAANFDGLLRRVRLNGVRMLDLGSGRAWSARRLLAAGAGAVVATDILRAKYIGLETADLLIRADGRYFERVLCAMEQPPFAPGCFDAVFSTASVHHADSLERAFAGMAHVLREDGLLLLVNEPVRCWNRVHDLASTPEVLAGVNEHIYTIDEWLDAAFQAGFDATLLFPSSVLDAFHAGKLAEVVVPPIGMPHYLPSILARSGLRRLLAVQPLLRRIYYDYELPLTMIARKRRNLPPVQRRNQQRLNELLGRICAALLG